MIVVEYKNLGKVSPVAELYLEWVRWCFLHDWDHGLTINRSSVAGGAIEMMRKMYHYSQGLQLPHRMFELRALQVIDARKASLDWHAYEPHETRIHLLPQSFLFSDCSPRSEHTMYKFFRNLNLARMRGAHFAAVSIDILGQRSVSRTSFLRWIDRHGSRISDMAFLNEHLEVSSSAYLVLRIRREHLLEDAFDQLWNRERKELARPLRVRMSMGEAEIGQDLGGVQVEFFALVYREALNPDCGIFVTDPKTHLSYFQPGSLEPLHRFELLGLLVGLAAYNGITMPINFPLAFYKVLLDEVVHYDDVEEGWPDQYKSLDDLYHYTGNIEEDIARDYVFSYGANGHYYEVPMNNDGHGPVIPVTNENVLSYTEDYMLWLAFKSVQKQAESFRTGFNYCIDAKARALLTPTLLRTLLEGSRKIDIEELEYCSKTYKEGYERDTPVVKWFWELVRTYSDDKKGELLQFVTACPRLPAGGLQDLTFVIQLVGPDGNALPTSQTCFGTLTLPEYSSKEKLAAKLDMALEWGEGFGVA
ncbi:hypothetical protein LTR66_000618 [Elasticomyces elasticus]|nr:hypothetical protein LTR66_000618 [Elasticomyces elasticus]